MLSTTTLQSTSSSLSSPGHNPIPPGYPGDRNDPECLGKGVRKVRSTDRRGSDFADPRLLGDRSDARNVRHRVSELVPSRFEDGTVGRRHEPVAAVRRKHLRISRRWLPGGQSVERSPSTKTTLSTTRSHSTVKDPASTPPPPCFWSRSGQAWKAAHRRHRLTSDPTYWM